MATELEAQALARDIRSLHEDHGVAWKGIGVLLRGRSDLEVYLGALRAADVPYAVEGDRSYYQRREVIEAAALVRSVLDSNDHLALLALLRSAAVGVPDVALIPLWTRGLASRIGALSEPSPELLEALRAELAEMRLPVADGGLRLTVSIGVAECKLETETPEDALNRADAAMYAAKDVGRNAVRVG